MLDPPSHRQSVQYLLYLRYLNTMPTDSSKKQLGIPEVIVAAIQEQKVPQKMVGPHILAIVKETSMPGTDVKQFGNTVFITHIKEREGEVFAFGRPLNADTARNYLKNVENYVKFLVDEKLVKYFFTYYKDSRLDSVVKYLKLPKVQERIGAQLKIKTKEAKGRTAVGVEVEGQNG